jgi:hypothetical protein
MRVLSPDAQHASEVEGRKCQDEIVLLRGRLHLT